tara:strand:- start:495 stop:755 length:261 start_codon:yes stop_codon:yes gene_type:complete
LVFLNVDDYRGFVVEFIRRLVKVIQGISDIGSFAIPRVEFRRLRFHFVFDRVVIHSDDCTIRTTEIQERMRVIQTIIELISRKVKV